MKSKLIYLLISGIMINIPAFSQSLPKCQIPECVGVQTKPNYATAEGLKAISDAGVKIIRRGFYWNGIETQKGVYNFAEYDELVKNAEENGLRILGVLFGNNKLHEDDNRGGIQTEGGRKAFANFAAALAEHFKGKGIVWEIWNEPNVRTFWRKDGMHNSEEFAEEYTALVKEVVPAMRKADPNCLVLAGSVSNFWEPSYKWTEFCFAKGIYKSGISGWSVHPYGVKTPEEFTIGYNITRDIMKKYDVPQNFPIVNTERGFSVEFKKTWGDHRDTEGWSGGPNDMATQYQAWHLVRQFMIDQLNKINFTIWYEWAPKDETKFAIVNGNEKRPAFFALQNMIKQLSKYSLKERIKTDSELDYLLLFQNAEGKKKIVAWTCPPPKESPDKAIPHTISIDLKPGETAEALNIFGEKTKAEVSAEKISVEISGSPLYITILNK
ncbi:MAG TPA: cellulase family glycosylhydrolase [Victivallales bacterium]|nr:cellulase family glycosylhydrolase [Victivallales bacterium]HRR28327.1 cellulase family glycosylhydrolase [Victivallales bacterium]